MDSSGSLTRKLGSCISQGGTLGVTRGLTLELGAAGVPTPIRLASSDGDQTRRASKERDPTRRRSRLTYWEHGLGFGQDLGLMLRSLWLARGGAR